MIERLSSQILREIARRKRRGFREKAPQSAQSIRGAGMFRRLEMERGAAQQVCKFKDHRALFAAELVWQENRLSKTRLVVGRDRQVTKESARAALPKGCAIREILGVQDGKARREEFAMIEGHGHAGTHARVAYGLPRNDGKDAAAAEDRMVMALRLDEPATILAIVVEVVSGSGDSGVADVSCKGGADPAGVASHAAKKAVAALAEIDPGLGEGLLANLSDVAAKEGFMQAEIVDIDPPGVLQSRVAIGIKPAGKRIRARAERELRRVLLGRRGELADDIVIHAAEHLARALDKQRIPIGTAGKADPEWVEKCKIDCLRRKITGSDEPIGKEALLFFAGEEDATSGFAAELRDERAQALPLFWLHRVIGHEELRLAPMLPQIRREAAHGPLEQRSAVSSRGNPDGLNTRRMIRRIAHGAATLLEFHGRDQHAGLRHFHKMIAERLHLKPIPSVLFGIVVDVRFQGLELIAGEGKFHDERRQNACRPVRHLDSVYVFTQRVDVKTRPAPKRRRGVARGVRRCSIGAPWKKR